MTGIRVNKPEVDLIIDRLNTDGFEKILFISDIHSPHEDTEALSKVYSFISAYEPDKIILGGDIIDAPQISSFIKEVDESRLKDDILHTVNILEKIRDTAGSSTPIYYLCGNHERRLHKYLLRNCPDLADLPSLQFERILLLEAMDIEYIPYGRCLEYKNCLFEHGYLISKFAGYTAKNQLESRRMSGVSGHSHRLAHYRHVNYFGQQFWLESGCLCNLEADYIAGIPNWTHGFSYLLFDDNNCVHAEAVEI